ncbi:hypothetical protein PV08_10561 [Exophiala spinifera]|uniref:Protein kinase domain-containing protein n=1 Tax=Exophiala spinifera TaxID=91928 RepID=A0A0D1Y8D7_9EURO|nr:uncharacterized protein PV08_10561 [Exophiala spinifera]KIW11261.1 hypothetical protein PV08_10561 [Exophiala spinifera]
MSVTNTDTPCTVARREILNLNVRDSESPSQFFYPRDRLRTYLTRENVAKILQCPCRKCRRQYEVFRRNHAPTEFLDRIVGPENDVEACHNPARTAYSLFGLLIYIEHALLIIGFMMKEVYDVNISGESFSAESLKRVCDAFFREEGQHAFNSFENQFSIFLRHFAIPTMESGTYSVYASDRILPFFEQRRLSLQGANSKVYAFKIYDEYRKFPHAGEVAMYARKELDKDSELAFHMENRNLNLATMLKDDHIVKMIKPYKHGDTFNLIFAYAKANLDDILRKSGPDLAEAGPSPVESRREWKQLLGVARALSKIGGPRGNQYLFGQTSRPEHLGVHFDLKPANILIDKDNIWMISDFGQAVFKPTGDTSSRMVNQGGTLAYAPPEMNIDAKSSRRYDIWSLGCITLEVLAFAIHGTHGLNGCEAYQGLDAVRRTNNLTSGQEDSALWYQDDDKKYRVKPAVFEFMQFLLRAEPLQHRPSSLSFVNRIIDLITKMLEPVADDRIDIGEVVRLLEAAIEESNDQTQPLDMTPNDGEVPIGELELQCIR